MRISILAVGADKAAPETTLCDEYLRRVQRQGRAIGITAVRSESFAESRRNTNTGRKSQEAERLLAAIRTGSRIIVLSERGKQHTSEGFATFIRRSLDDGMAETSFLIGGPDGHDRALEERADMLLSLGQMTWPHRLARVMIAEQIYRAVTILTNHPYHRS